jgi:hypothetical protein
VTADGDPEAPDTDSSQPDQTTSPRRSIGELARQRNVGIGTVVAVAALAALVVWLVVESGRSSSSSQPTTSSATTSTANAPPSGVKPMGPLIVTRSTLSSLQSSLGHSIYWAGPRPRQRYELTETAGGYTFIRYLPASLAAGAAYAGLVVATYPMSNAYSATDHVANLPDVEKVGLPGGGVAAFPKKTPTTVFLAFPGVDAQVEVYHPSPDQVRKLVTGGKVVPVG